MMDTLGLAAVAVLVLLLGLVPVRVESVRLPCPATMGIGGRPIPDKPRSSLEPIPSPFPAHPGAFPRQNKSAGLAPQTLLRVNTAETRPTRAVRTRLRARIPAVSRMGMPARASVAW